MDDSVSVEPYLVLEEEGREIEYRRLVPTARDSSTAVCRAALTWHGVAFERQPLDVLAYLAASGHEVECGWDISVVRTAVAALDLLIIVPITSVTERLLLSTAAMAELRRTVNDVPPDFVHKDPLDI
ncbi:hypothetical protein AB0M48_38775 [Lentzea sp. NPDC051208]|uniref:hypothetical protein n=1 Tax=Lentzea sp. NPDC051208 TaxID=3154642 RepID=UPI00342734C4